MSRFFRTGIALAAAIAATGVAAQLAGAEDQYPSRPVKLVVPLPAGTSPDVRARVVADQLSIVPYATGGTGAAVSDLLGGRVHVVVVSLAAHKGVFDSGDLKALAIMTGERPPSAPSLPTAAETFPGLTAVGWMVLAAPKGTPDSVVHRLSEDLSKMLQAPNVRATLDEADLIFRPMFSTELAHFIEAEQALWWPVVKATAQQK